MAETALFSIELSWQEGRLRALEFLLFYVWVFSVFYECLMDVLGLL